MRADDFPEHKADPSDIRVMFIGDSVINGGARDAPAFEPGRMRVDRSLELGRAGVEVVHGNRERKPG